MKRHCLLTKAALASLVLLTYAASAAEAQGVNADYLPFPQSRLRRFPLKRHAFPPGVSSISYGNDGLQSMSTRKDVSTLL